MAAEELGGMLGPLNDDEDDGSRRGPLHETADSHGVWNKRNMYIELLSVVSFDAQGLKLKLLSAFIY